MYSIGNSVNNNNNNDYAETTVLYVIRHVTCCLSVIYPISWNPFMLLDNHIFHSLDIPLVLFKERSFFNIGALHGC